MRIGIDFDNTIVRYDALFHRIGREMAELPAALAPTKLAVRAALRASGREALWTEMQGLAYGPRMAEAEAFPGIVAFLRQARGRGHDLFIVSHRTRTPFIGPAYDLHAAARAWTRARLVDADGPLLPEDRIFFEPTKEEKLARIGALGCDLFIDDLPEILLASGFPPKTRRLLFDPDGQHGGQGLERVADWSAVLDLLGAP